MVELLFAAQDGKPKTPGDSAVARCACETRQHRFRFEGRRCTPYELEFAHLPGAQPAKSLDWTRTSEIAIQLIP